MAHVYPDQLVRSPFSRVFISDQSGRLVKHLAEGEGHLVTGLALALATGRQTGTVSVVAQDLHDLIVQSALVTQVGRQAFVVFG